jgi:hypothetical protein
VLARIKTALRVHALERRARSASKREQAALERVGAHVFSASRSAGLDERSPPDARATYEQLLAVRTRLEQRDSALARSLADDRRDYADASELARWAVIGRGLLDRAALRDRAKHERRECARLERELGRAALDGADVLRTHVPEPLAADVAAARTAGRTATDERAKLLEPYAGKPLPGWLAAAVREVRVFLGFVWDGLSKKFILRAPAIAGLLVGWWLGRKFSDSTMVAWAHEHIGIDLRDAAEKQQQERLAFWLPLLAAALCSYVGWTITTRVRRKYASEGETK